MGQGVGAGRKEKLHFFNEIRIFVCCLFVCLLFSIENVEMLKC